MTYLIDTDWVLNYLRGSEPAISILPRLREDGIAVSIVTFIEVYEGIYGGRDAVSAERSFRAFLRAAPVIGVNRAVARETARIRLDLRRRGRAVNHRALDILITATAMTHGLTLVTGNRRDYLDIAGLTLYGATG